MYGPQNREKKTQLTTLDYEIHLQNHADAPEVQALAQSKKIVVSGIDAVVKVVGSHLCG